MQRIKVFWNNSEENYIHEEINGTLKTGNAVNQFMIHLISCLKI
jgi:hypothetical protein